MGRHPTITRRTCLRGLGIAMALPLLETMSWGETAKSAGRSPVRLGFLHSSFGVYPDAFWPKDAKSFGPAGALPPTLEPLRAVLGDCLLVGGVGNPGVSAEGRSSHLIETASWLTAAPPLGPGKLEVAVSADQVAAQQIGAYTAIPSLELGVMPSNFSYAGEKGYAGGYYQTVSYRTPTQALPVETSARAVLNRLFSSRRSIPRKRGGPLADTGRFAGAGGAGAATDEGPSLDQSMLDVVRESAGDLRRCLSGADQRTVDEYLDGVRTLEKRVVAIERQQAEAAKAKAERGGARKGLKYSEPITVDAKDGELKWSEHVRLLGDLMILAFQTDMTRVVSLMFEHPFGLTYPEIGVNERHHTLSHHDNDKAKIADLLKIERFQIEQLAYVVARMKTLMDGNGSLLDNSIILWGSGMSHGFTHNNTSDLPTIVAGRGGGTVRPGRYVRTAGTQGDVLLGILARAGCTVTTLGNGTRPSPDLS